MKLLRSPLFAVLCLCFSTLIVPSVTAQQVAVYGAVDYTGYAFNNNLRSNYFFYKAGAPGFTLGAFYNFPIDSRFTAGIDVRNTYSPGSKGGDAVGASLRLAFVPHRVRLRPFFQIGGGVVSSSANIEIQNDNGLIAGHRYTNGAALLDAGLDIRLTDTLDLRALDYGAEAGSTVGVTFADVGLVCHFPSRK